MDRMMKMMKEEREESKRRSLVRLDMVRYKSEFAYD